MDKKDIEEDKRVGCEEAERSYGRFIFNIVVAVIAAAEPQSVVVDCGLSPQ
ncbi:MAG: hypothetical protein FWG57_02680 [Endomicrobia bacterium]|nr:hypothetical protein [Endomicrobiia bacterium]